METLQLSILSKKNLKIHFLLSFLVLVITVNCSNDTGTDLADLPVKLKTSNKQLQTNFDSCLHLTRQLIKTQVSDKEFLKFFSLNKGGIGFGYNYVVQNISDTLFSLPKTYQILYGFVYKEDTITSFRADFDSSIKIIDYRNYDLLAFRQFIDKKLTVTRSRATTIALDNGMKTEHLELIFKCSEAEFYWECKNDCSGCQYLEISARTGNIIGQGKFFYLY